MKTKAEKYNENAEKIMRPEIDRMRKCESIAKEILSELDKSIENNNELEDWQVINLIAGVIREHYYEFN